MVRCRICGSPCVIKTSWTPTNSGRRFFCCSKRGSNCGIIDWFDPLMCDRAVQIIPGLLRRMNDLQATNAHYRAQASNAENHVEATIPDYHREARRMKILLVLSLGQTNLCFKGDNMFAVDFENLEGCDGWLEDCGACSDACEGWVEDRGACADACVVVCEGACGEAYEPLVEPFCLCPLQDLLLCPCCQHLRHVTVFPALLNLPFLTKSSYISAALFFLFFGGLPIGGL
ncbi:zinc finger, GRF-type containing protein [Tanacetum coccineum]